MKFVVVSAVMVAIFLAVISCTNIITVHEHYSGKSHSHVDTVYVIIDPSDAPEEQEGWTSPGTQPGSGETGEYADPWITYYPLYDGARVETCTYSSGRTRHTLLGNIVTGSGPDLQVDGRVMRNDNIIEELVLILEFQIPRGSSVIEDASADGSRSRNDPSAADIGSDPSTLNRFLRIRSAGQQYGYDLDDCSVVDVDSDGDQMTVEAVLPVSLAVLRDISQSCSVSFSVAYPGTDSFEKYFTEVNDGNMYLFYTLFVIGDGNPTALPVER
jgi:hypothetical protein